jgi:vacuolar-type H+-ATPase subunit F/Vma7
VARLVALSTAALADGFRLAGVATTIASAGSDAAGQLRSLVDESDVGLVVVTEDLWASLDDRTREGVEHLPRPIVLALPAGVPTDALSRRELVAEMLRRAIGYRIELDEVAR